MPKKYIDQNAVLRHLNDVWYTTAPTDSMPDDVRDRAKARSEGIRDAMEAVGVFPAADVVEVRHGRWMSMDSENEVVGMDDDGCPVDSCCCSECGDWLIASDEYLVRGRYCPNCGAKMKGENDDA